LCRSCRRRGACLPTITGYTIKRSSSTSSCSINVCGTGAIVAASTTSLPERIGGSRNWDYPYAWIRDASLTIDALWIGTGSDEADAFVAWMEGAAGGHVHEDRPLQIMYSVGGERDLAERELPHLRGHRDSKAVRVGNGASGWDVLIARHVLLFGMTA
jgi:GH15 family glucan-1,4-alpha-glucosidase